MRYELRHPIAFSTTLVGALISTTCGGIACSSSNSRLGALKAQVMNDIRPGKTLESASRILVDKYHALVLHPKYLRGTCDRLFYINDKVDRYGVWHTLTIRLYCKNGTVSMVRTAIAGTGP
jgi:hypothetical protein